MHLHVGTVSHGAIKVGDAVELRVDGERRAWRCAPIIR